MAECQDFSWFISSERVNKNSTWNIDISSNIV